MGDRGGRPAATSAHQLAVTAQRLFLDRGFDETSVDDIAAEAGVSRRTFFRYFASKADVVWLESSAELDRLRAGLAAAGADEPYAEVIVRSVVTALQFPPEHREWAWQRAKLLLTVPTVQAGTSRRFADWREAAAEFASRRSGLPIDALFPIAVGHAVLAGTLAAHEYWIAHPNADLYDVLTDALTLLLPHDGGDGQPVA
ncbi:MAG: TetR family transcriptional regulator [Aldersonia sp.]|nr:TetR family transcriptional regulator [Aldersonia sp.]